MRPLVAAGLLLLVATSSMGCKKKWGRTSPTTTTDTPLLRTPYSEYALNQICEKNPLPYDGNPAFVKSTKPSPVAVFQRDIDGATIGSYANITIPAFKGTAIAPEKPHEVQLVACVDSTIIPESKPRYCSYNGPQVKVYAIKHKVRLVEAKTGKVVKEEEFVLDNKTTWCEGSRSFRSGTTTVSEGIDANEKIASVVMPFEPDGVKLAPATSFALTDVCSGDAVPQAEAYVPGTPTRIHMVYFPDPRRSQTTDDPPTGMPAFDDNRQDASSYGLVACITGQPKKKKRDCEFTNNKVLTLWDGDFEVQMREARTGKIIETKSFKGTSSASSCPMFHEFWSKDDQLMTKVEPALAKYLGGFEGRVLTATK